MRAPNRGIFWYGLFTSSFLSIALVALVDFAAAQTATALPDSWKSLPPAEFVSLVRGQYTDPVTNRLRGLAATDYSAVQTQAAGFLANIDLTNPNLDLAMVDTLVHLGKSKLSDAEKSRLQMSLQSRQENWTGKPWKAVSDKCQLMSRLDMDGASIQFRNWDAAAGDRSSIPAGEAYVARRQLVDGTGIDGSFNVEWSGLVTVPQAGSWTFSITPFNTNARPMTSRDSSRAINIESTLSVNGNQIVSTNAAEWNSRGTPVSLTVGQAVPVKLTMSVKCKEIPQGTVHMQLYWEGPGQMKDVIPASAFKQSDGQTAGIKGTYSWTTGGAPQTATRIHPAIDFAWTEGNVFLPNNGDTQDWSALIAPALTPEGMARYLPGSGTGEVHPLFPHAWETSPLMTSAQRRTFLRGLAQQPELLEPLTPKRLWHLIAAYRYGAPDESLDVLGQWATRHPDAPCEYLTPPGVQFDQENRNSYRLLALAVTQEMPGQADVLQGRYLQAADGSCNLPVAYILAYSYLGRDKLQDWIDLLADRLNDNKLNGDNRLNWLLARAHAQEIRQAVPDPYQFISQRITDGRVYLDEGWFYIESPAAKLRLCREVTARLLTFQQYDDITKIVDQTAKDLPQEMQGSLTSLKNQVASLRAYLESQTQSQAADADQNYIKTLKSRMEQASQAGNTEAAARYGKLLSDLRAK